MEEARTAELKTPLIVEDFEQGDKIYFIDSKHAIVRYGVVEGASGQRVQVKLDNHSSPMNIHISQFNNGSCGKLFDLESLKVGDFISTGRYGGRSYAVVLEIVPGEKVTVQYDSRMVHHFFEKDTEPIGFQMSEFETEG